MAINTFPNGTDPLYVKYAAPVIANSPVSTPYATKILSSYLPIVFDVTWAGDSTTDPISKKRVKAELYYGATPLLLGTQVKTSLDVGGQILYRFNFAEMLKTVFNSEIYNNISSDQINTGNENLVMPFYVVFTPMYLDIKGVEREDDSLTSATAYCSSAIIQNLDNYNKFTWGTPKLLNDYSVQGFLTNAPTTKKIRANETEQLSFYYTNILSHTVQLNYTVYDLAGSPTSYTKSLVDVSTSKYGTLTISDVNSNCLLDGISAISKIDVFLKNSSGTIISETRTFTIDTKCSDGYRLVWVNQYGTIDKYTFDAHKSRKFNVTDREVYKTELAKDRSISDRSVKVLNTKGDYGYSCTSKFIASDLEWFTELLTTNECYWEKEQNVLIPVIITSSEQIIEDDGLINVTVDFITSQVHITR